jgi:hypothetical protein
MDGIFGIRLEKKEKVVSEVSSPHPLWRKGWTGIVNAIINLIIDCSKIFIAPLFLLDSGLDSTQFLQVRATFEDWFE